MTQPAKNIPRHIAIIMDGNGRWAKQRGFPRAEGHRIGMESVRAMVRACSELGVEYLTLYAFSTENWNRPITEVSALMTLLLKTIKAELKTLLKNDIRLKVIGDMTKLPVGVAKELTDAMQRTANNKRMDFLESFRFESETCCH